MRSVDRGPIFSQMVKLSPAFPPPDPAAGAGGASTPGGSGGWASRSATVTKLEVAVDSGRRSWAWLDGLRVRLRVTESDSGAESESDRASLGPGIMSGPVRRPPSFGTCNRDAFKQGFANEQCFQRSSGHRGTISVLDVSPYPPAARGPGPGAAGPAYRLMPDGAPSAGTGKSPAGPGAGPPRGRSPRRFPRRRSPSLAQPVARRRAGPAWKAGCRGRAARTGARARVWYGGTREITVRLHDRARDRVRPAVRHPTPPGPPPCPA